MARAGNDSMNLFKKKCCGYTVIEGMIAIVISSIIILALYQMFHSQQKNYISHNDSYNMNQNLRAATYLLTKEIRSAGYNPTKINKPTVGFVSDFNSNIFSDIGLSSIDYRNDKSRIAFTLDKNSDKCIDADNLKDSEKITPPCLGDTTTKDFNASKEDGNRGEQIAYRLYKNILQRFNSEIYSATNSLEQAWQNIATNIDALNFVFLDQNNAPINDPLNNTNQIKSIAVSILAKTEKKDHKFINTTTYRNQQGDILCPTCAKDHYHRQQISTIIRLRNL